VSKREAGSGLEDKLKSCDKIFVLFYASWCPFSQDFLPVFEEYAKANPKACMTVEISDAPELCDKVGVEYYPTVICFEKGKVKKRLDAKPGVGLNKGQLSELIGRR